MSEQVEDGPEGEGFDVAAFVRDNGDWLRRRVVKKLGPRGGELDDVLQGTYVDLVRAAPRIRSETHARRFCLKVASNVAKGNARRKLPFPTEVLPDTADSAPDPADVVAAREAVRLWLATLTPEQRKAFVAREGYGLSYAAIGSILSSTPHAARNLVYRARCTLQQCAHATETTFRDGLHLLVLHVLNTRPKWSLGATHDRTWAHVLGGSMIIAAVGATGPAPAPAVPDPVPRDQIQSRTVRERREVVPVPAALAAGVGGHRDSRPPSLASERLNTTVVRVCHSGPCLPSENEPLLPKLPALSTGTPICPRTLTTVTLTPCAGA